MEFKPELVYSAVEANELCLYYDKPFTAEKGRVRGEDYDNSN